MFSSLIRTGIPQTIPDLAHLHLYIPDRVQDFKQLVTPIYI